MIKNKKVTYPLEEEVDEWRAKVLEQYKNLSGNERTEKINEHARELAKQYGFKIAKAQ